jgi:hypothetical protein
MLVSSKGMRRVIMGRGGVKGVPALPLVSISNHNPSQCRVWPMQWNHAIDAIYSLSTAQPCHHLLSEKISLQIGM